MSDHTSGTSEARTVRRRWLLLPLAAIAAIGAVVGIRRKKKQEKSGRRRLLVPVALLTSAAAAIGLRKRRAGQHGDAEEEMLAT